MTERKPRCPYCKKELDTKPKRKKKCPHCGEYIFVRKGRLKTANDVKVDDWMVKLEGYGVKKRDYNFHKGELKKQYGFEPPINDVIWRILNQLAAKGEGGYHFMAQIAVEEGKDPKPYVTEGLRQTLLGFKQQGMIGRARILTVNDYDVCDGCKQLHEKTFDLDYAIENMPIPNNCTNDRCRCYYQPVVSVDLFRESLRETLEPPPKPKKKKKWWQL